MQFERPRYRVTERQQISFSQRQQFHGQVGAAEGGKARGEAGHEGIVQYLDRPDLRLRNAVRPPEIEPGSVGFRSALARGHRFAVEVLR